MHGELYKTTTTANKQTNKAKIKQKIRGMKIIFS